MSYSGYINLLDLGKIANGLNIEGCKPTYTLPKGCKWYNIVQVVDEPLKGDTFEKVMTKVRDGGYDLIEEAVGIDCNHFLNQLTAFINNVKKDHKNLLVHIHQYTGSTKLDLFLKEKTGVTCILDGTNFFETPVNYSEEYPDIDGLISLSQCAGFNLPAGSWIVPQYYINFDVKDCIIYNIPEYAINHAEKYLPPYFQYTKSPIFVVNDLWNPDINKEEEQGYLVLDTEGIEVLSFVKEHTKIFDETHNWQHAVQVALNSCQILNTRDVLYLALLHDVCDHKYPESLERELLSKWIMRNLKINEKRRRMIDTMIDQVSFSKQKKSGDMSKVHPVLEAVRDGDRMEAIGEIGIFRCEEFTRLRGGKVPQDVVQHCHDKLLRLMPEGYIVNKTSEVVRRHNVILDYVKKNT